MKRYWPRLTVLVDALLLAGCGFTTGIGGPVRTLGLTLTPESGPVGALVKVSGTDFSTAQSVTVGGKNAVLVSSSTTSMTAFVMPGTTSGPISIVTAGATYISTGSFTVT